ncbi:hypothetical protein CBS147352_2459 [Aspergillus niger]|nr:hypothetical protein CBS147324_5835 [Aspergillus niger]KAI3056379.1 hypothetical protein CBS147352_2459 [Aspergillus niger]
MGQTPSTPQPGTKLQVIGAGLPRTGTASFSAALAILLDGPVYHGGTQTTIGPPDEITTWMKIMRLVLNENPLDRQQALTLIDHQLDGYAAITDAPGSQLVPELVEVYPDAKVICTVRDPVAWGKSMTQVEGLVRSPWFLRVMLLPLPGMRHFVDYLGLTALQWRRLYGRNGGPGGAYHKHIEWLKEVVPEESSWPDVLGVMAAKGIEGLKMKELKPVELPDDDNLPVARVWVEDGVFVPVGQDAPPKSGKEE